MLQLSTPAQVGLGVGLTVCAGVHYYRQHQLRASLTSLKGKRVLITGASRGIGEQLAYEYAKHGAQLVLAARSLDALQKVADGCTALGSAKVQVTALNASSDASRQHVVNEAVKALKGIDILVLNHTASMYSNYFDLADPMKTVEQAMATNYLGYVGIAHHAMPHLIKAEAQNKAPSSIIVVSSMTAVIPNPRTSAYAASKAAINMFFNVLRRDLGPKAPVKITVGIVGLVGTEAALSVTPKRIHKLAGDPASCARALMHAGVMQDRSVFYPWWYGPFCTMFHLFPGFVEAQTNI